MVAGISKLPTMARATPPSPTKNLLTLPVFSSNSASET